MTTSSLVLVLALVAGGLAAPWGTDVPRCSIECPVTGSPKLAYEPGKTYTYAYSGKSQVQLKGVQDDDSEIEWAAGVDLTWISPCDVAISFRNMKMDGAPGPDAARALERYPMVVAVADGRVQHVCAHPEDQPWAINLKKGVASALQNSMPALSPIASGITVTETDVVGKCPTKYEVETEGEKVIVTKEKNHRHCHERFPTATEIPALWMKAPLPIEESRSECKQEITNGIYTAITCEDKNIVRPAFGLYKYVEANQESTLRFISESSETSAISAITRGELEIESLLYNHETTKDAELAPEVDELMKEICEKTENTVEADAAALVAKAIHLLRRVPASVVERVAEKVRGGHYCGESARLESIFLDAIAFLHEPSAVKVMVEEIEKGRATGGRLALYTAALYLTPRPNTEAVEALTPLFESARPVPSVMLAAASMLNKYCRLAPHCHEEAPVERIAEALATKVERHCSPSAGVEAEEEALAALKALGNMGVVTPAVARAAVSCIEKHEAPTTIRVAAANAFRQAKCYRPAIEKLVNIAVEPRFETEVRIAAYLSAIRCAEMEDLEEIFAKISAEENTQVRGFILGHLMNIQESTCPTKERLRYLLTNFVIPADFERDFRKFSRNVQMGYHAPAFGMGADVESNIVYAPGSFVPRAVTMNLRTEVEDVPMDIAEIGARFEGIDAIIEELFGPEGYLRKAAFGKILEDVTGFAEEKGAKMMDHLQRTMRTKRSIDVNTISEFFDKLYGDSTKETRAEVFARIMGQEVTFANLAEVFRGITADELIETVFGYFDHSLEQMKNFNLDTARAAQLFMDYTLPTIQGLPLKLKLSGTAVVGLKLGGNLNLAEILADLRNMNAKVTLLPSLSVEATGFVGFDCFVAKAGLEMRGTVASANGAALNIRVTEGEKIEVELELPEKMELLNLKAETFLVKAIGKKEMRVTPPSMKDVRVRHESCLAALEPALGLKLCYELNLPDVVRSDALPLGQPIVARIFAEKAEEAMKGYLMTAALKNTAREKVVEMTFETTGATTPRRAKVAFSYTTEGEAHVVATRVDSSAVEAGVWASFTNAAEYKAIETFFEVDAGAFEVARGVKVALETKGRGAEAEVEVSAFFAPNKRFAEETRVFEAKVSKKVNGDDVIVDAVCKTKNALAQVIDIDAEVGIDFTTFSPTILFGAYRLPTISVPLPTNVRVMEVTAGVANWKVATFVRGGHETPEDCRHVSAFKLTKGRREVLSFEAEHKIEGTLGRNIIVKNEIAVGVGSAAYKAKYDVFYHTNKIGFAFDMMSEGGEKIAEMEALYTAAGEDYNTKFVMAVPEYMEPIKVEAKVAPQAEDRFMLEAAVKHGNAILLEASGPVVARFSYKIMKLQTTIKVSGETIAPHTIATNVVFGSKKQVIALEIKEREDPVFAVEWKLVRDDSAKSTIGAVLVLPTLIEYKLDAIVAEELVHVSFNNLVLPGSPMERRVKGFADVHIAEKKTNVELAWDADKAPQKKIAIDATLIAGPQMPDKAQIHGNVIFIGETYHVKMDLSSTSGLESVIGENGIEATITTPAQKTFGFEARSNIELDGAAVKATVTLGCKTPENEEYRMINHVVLEKGERRMNFELENKANFATPAGEAKTGVAMEIEYNNEEFNVKAEVGAEAPFLRAPFKAVFTSRNTETATNGVFKMERDAPVTIYEWGLKASPEGGLEEIEAGFDMRGFVEMLKVVRALVSFEKEALAGRLPASGRYYYRLNKAAPAYNFVARTPSRTMEGEAKFSPYDIGLKFYPNKERSEAKYELGFKGRPEEEVWGERRGEWEIHAHHPAMVRPAKVAMLYTTSEEAMKGTIELDIFPEHENKITGTLETRFISKTAFRTEAFLTGKLLKNTPKVTIDLGYGPETLAFGLMFQGTPTAAPTLEVSFKYDQTSSSNAAVAVKIEKEGRPVFAITGATEPEVAPTCDGVAMKGFFFAEDFGEYDLVTKMCKPAFVEVVAKRRGGERAVIAKMGLRFPDAAQIGFYVANGDMEEVRPAAVAAVTLATPTLVDIQLTFAPEAPEVMVEIAEVIFEMLKAAETTAMEVFRFLEEEAAAKGVAFPSSTFITMAVEAKAEVIAIIREVLAEARELDLAVIRDILESPAFEYISRVYLTVWTRMANLQDEVVAHLVREINNIEEMMDLPEDIKEFIMEIMHMIETGEMPEIVRDFVEKIEETKMYKMIVRMINEVIAEYPEEYEAIKYVVTKVLYTLERDIKELTNEIMEMPAVQKIINWIIHHFNSEDVLVEVVKTTVSRIMEELFFYSMETAERSVRVRIPLHRPLYSLTQVAQEAVPYPKDMLVNIIWAYIEYIPIPVEDLLWAYYNFVPRSITELTAMLPPYPRVAMVVGGTEILTFDGLVVRAPRSPCKVLLASHGSHRIIMSHPQAEAQPELEIKTPRATIVIKPDLEVLVNGRPVRSATETVGNVRIENNAKFIEVGCPLMKVIVEKEGHVVAVEASGWTFGRVAGLLGPNNGEMGDGLLTPTGEVASNFRELVAAWQEDKQCSTPEVPRAETTVARVIECGAFLGIRSRCNPVVRPEPFVEMCHAARDACGACDAAKAYRTICALKGVEEVFPLAC